MCLGDVVAYLVHSVVLVEHMPTAVVRTYVPRRISAWVWLSGLSGCRMVAVPSEFIGLVMIVGSVYLCERYVHVHSTLIGASRGHPDHRSRSHDLSFVHSPILIFLL
jgi:hypothetical protein